MNSFSQENASLPSPAVDSAAKTASARGDLRLDEGYRFVDRSFFSSLLVSNRRLDRRDVRHARLRGLFDKVNQEWFVIEEEKLFPAAF